MIRFVCLFLTVATFAGLFPSIGTSQLKKDDWPAFRGANNSGISQATNVPINWGTQQNIKWKVPLPMGGNGSPIIVGDRVFVTCAQDPKGAKRTLYCFGRKGGKKLWEKTIKVTPGITTHRTNPYCATTPASNGKVVVVWHGTGGLHCYDLDGNENWSRDLGKVNHQWGYASSPIIYKEKVILNRGPGNPTYMIALNLKDGKTIWKTDEKLAGNGKVRKDGTNIGTWATPVITKVNGQLQVVCAMPTRVVGYDLEKGDILWSCEGLSQKRGDLIYSSPQIKEDLCLVIGGYRGPSFAVKMGGKGDITNENRLWRNKQNPQSIGSGVFVGGYLYAATAGPSFIQCIDPKTGKTLWSERVGDNHWGSVIYADGRLYVTDQVGTTRVFRPNPEKLEIIAANELNERCNSTPAVCNGQIIIRTYENLYCFGE